MRVAAIASLTAMALVASLSACDFADSASAAEDIVIAADLELSGAMVDIGTAYEHALRLKVDQLNQQGILAGRKIRLLVEDNRSDRTLSQTNISKFADNNEVAAVITGSCSSCIIANAKVLNERRIPTISLAPATEAASPVTDRRWIFKIGPNADDNAVALAAEIARSGVRNVGLVVTDDEYGTEGKLALERELLKRHVDMTPADVKPTDDDLAQPIRRLLEPNDTKDAKQPPTALVFWMYPAQASKAAVSARTAGFKGKMFFDSAAAGDLFLGGAAATATSEATMISPQTMAIDDVIATTPAKAARKQWFRDYTSRYGSYFGYASYAADAVQLLVNAMTSADGTNGEQVRDALEAQEVEGLSGPLRVSTANHSGLMPQALTVLVSRDGRWRAASEKAANS